MTPRSRSLLATMVLIVVVVLMLWQHVLLAHRPIEVGLQAAAVVLMLWARWTFGARSFHASATPTAGGLVMTGPYRYWRHPIYAAILLFVWAGTFGQVSPPAVSAVILAGVASLMTALRIQAEEQLLFETFPDYASYAARTKRLLPFVF